MTSKSAQSKLDAFTKISIEKLKLGIDNRGGYKYRGMAVNNYSDYEPYKAVYDMSKSLSGLKKVKCHKAHEHKLVMYENM